MPPHPPLFEPAAADAPPRAFVIAELGVNHDGDPDRAMQLVEAAAAAGADAVKLQLFRPERLLSRQAKLAAYQAGAAGDPHELLGKLALPLDAIAAVRDAAGTHDLAFVVTPFSPGDVADLARLGVDAVKIASPDAVNPMLWRPAMELGVPVLVSTGTCELDELDAVAAALREHRPGGCLLQCVSAYPTDEADASLAGIGVLRERFGLPAGYSDHTASAITGALAVAAGAVVIEKHFTYDRAAAGPDHAASLDPVRFREYVHLAREAEAMHGPLRKAVLPCERDVREVSRQSLCAVRDLPAGHRLAAGDLTVKRPGTGVPPAELERVIGRRLAQPLPADDLLTACHLADD